MLKSKAFLDFIPSLGRLAQLKHLPNLRDNLRGSTFRPGGRNQSIPR